MGFQECVRRASETRLQWSHLSDEESAPRPSYDDYLAVRRASDELKELASALFDPEAMLIVALIDLRDLRVRYQEPNMNPFRQEAEQDAERLLTICEQIKYANCNLEYLLFEVPAFDNHYDRYCDEAESRD